MPFAMILGGLGRMLKYSITFLISGVCTLSIASKLGVVNVCMLITRQQLGLR